MKIREDKLKAAHKLVDLIPGIKSWHFATFPEATEQAQESKYEEELHEAVTEQNKMKDLSANPSEALMLEVADTFIAAIGMYRFNDTKAGQMLNHILSGISDKAFIFLPDFVARKMEINRARTWVKDTTGVYRHIEKEA